VNATDRRDPRPRPPVSWWRDPWGWASVLAVLPLVLHSLGAPLGVLVADDWDLVSRGLAPGPLNLFDGGGSTAFWRPIPHQIYYRLFVGQMLARPQLIVILHTTLLAATALLAYRALRTRWPGPWAAAAASFPLLAESTRMLISWPGLMVELALLFFSALAVHEAAHRRLRTALAALLAALLSKEVAVVTALILPWVPPAAPEKKPADRSREPLRWIVGVAVVTVAWGIAYVLVRRANDLHLPHAFETAPQTVGTPWLERLRWTLVNGVRAQMSLPAVPVAREWACWAGVALLLAVAVWCYAREGAARKRLRLAAPMITAGTIWFAVSLAPLIVVYPMWMPHRTAIAGFGLGVALVGLLGAARPALLAALVALRLALFALSPGPPQRISFVPPATGAFLDFEKLTRLQRMMVETRRVLEARHPTLPHGARVGLLQPPLLAEYAFGESQALRAWYRDPTLRWERWEAFRSRPDPPLDALVVYEADRTPQMMLIEPEAMRQYLLAGRAVGREDWNGAIADLARADAALTDTTALGFRSRVTGRRAFCLLKLERVVEAEREARRAVALSRESSEGRYALACILTYTKRNRQAIAHLDTLLRFYPGDRVAATLRDSLRAWAAGKP
jgi:tetratricopeptide (TPR) repeat protein